MQIQAGPMRTRGSTPPCRLVEPLTQNSVTAVREAAAGKGKDQDQAGGKGHSFGCEISDPKTAQGRFANVTVDCERKCDPRRRVTWMGDLVWLTTASSVELDTVGGQHDVWI